MAQGTSEQGGTFFYVKPKHLKPGENEYPCMELIQKKGENYEVVNTVNFLTGHITEISKVDKMIEKYGRFRGVKFTLSDLELNEKYVFDLPYSGPSREMLNRLATLSSFKDMLKISFYRGDKGYAGTSVKVFTSSGEQKLEIKYGYKEHIEPRMKKVMFQGKELNDYTKVDDMFDALIDTVLSKFEVATSKQPSNTPAGTVYKDLNVIEPEADNYVQPSFSPTVDDNDLGLPF
jgi:hypothetical protein